MSLSCRPVAVTCRHRAERAKIPHGLHASVTNVSRGSSATGGNGADDGMVLPERATEGVQPRLITDCTMCCRVTPTLLFL